MDPTRRALDLRAYAESAAACTKCRLSEGRTQVVFGVGDPDANLMFVGEAPGFHEDKQGFPFVGQAGKLLDRLLEGIGLSRAEVYIANVLKCRPPGNRDPAPDEIEQCEPHLFRQLELIQPRVVAIARQLRDQAAVREAHRDHARARPGAAGRRRRARGAAVPALPPGGGALHARDAEGARAGLRPAARAARHTGRARAARPTSLPWRSCSASASPPCSSASSRDEPDRVAEHRRERRRASPPEPCPPRDQSQGLSLRTWPFGNLSFVPNVCRFLHSRSVGAG